MSRYSLHESLLGIATDFQYAFDNGDLGLARRTIDHDLATVYVLVKELELHGYEAFKKLIDQYNQGEDVKAGFDLDNSENAE